MLFYIGGALYQLGIFNYYTKPKRLFIIVSGIIVVCSGISICKGRLIDTVTGFFLGEGINPPGFDSMVYP